MSSSKIQLNVLPDDQSSEVIILNGKFQVCARGIANVQLAVQQGIYNAKLRVGDQFSEKLFLVKENEPNGEKKISLPPLEFPSPIPLQYTSTFKESHKEVMCKATENFTATSPLGEGAAVLIYLRDISSMFIDLQSDDLATYAQYFQGFALSNLDGSESFSLEAIGTFVPKQGFLIASASVTPGNYVLSQLKSDKQRLCLPLVIPMGWSLQVFIPMFLREESKQFGADFDGAAMVFSKPNSGFDANSTELRISEVFRQALSGGRSDIDEKKMEAVKAVISEKLSNPMLGLLAAHLILRANETKLELVEKILDKVSTLLGQDYPDLLILRWKLQMLQNKYGTVDPTDAKTLIANLKSPPMFQLSWHYFMEAYRACMEKEVINEAVSNISYEFISAPVWLSWQASKEINPTKFSAKIDETDSEILTRVLANFPITKKTYTPSFSSVSNYLIIHQDIYSHEKQPIEHTVDEEDIITLKDLISSVRNAREGKIEELFCKLIQSSIDWKSIIADLKSGSLSDSTSLTLTPLQSKLLLLLKDAREQFECEKKLPDTIWLQRYIADVPMYTIGNALISLIQLLPKSENDDALSILKLILLNINPYHHKATIESKSPEIVTNQNSAESVQESPESVTLWDSLVVKKGKTREHIKKHKKFREINHISSVQNLAESIQESPESVTLWDSLIVKKDEAWEHVENDKKSREQNHEEGETSEE